MHLRILSTRFLNKVRHCFPSCSLFWANIVTYLERVLEDEYVHHAEDTDHTVSKQNQLCQIYQKFMRSIMYPVLFPFLQIRIFNSQLNTKSYIHKLCIGVCSSTHPKKKKLYVEITKVTGNTYYEINHIIRIFEIGYLLTSELGECFEDWLNVLWREDNAFIDHDGSKKIAVPWISLRMLRQAVNLQPEKLGS